MMSLGPIAGGWTPLREWTDEADIDLVRGKGYSYARAGVRENLALDPTGAFLPERGRDWRCMEGVYRLWEPDTVAPRVSRGPTVFARGTVGSGLRTFDKRNASSRAVPLGASILSSLA